MTGVDEWTDKCIRALRVRGWYILTWQQYLQTENRTDRKSAVCFDSAFHRLYRFWLVQQTAQWSNERASVCCVTSEVSSPVTRLTAAFRLWFGLTSFFLRRVTRVVLKSVSRQASINIQVARSVYRLVHARSTGEWDEIVCRQKPCGECLWTSISENASLATISSINFSVSSRTKLCSLKP